MHHPRKEEGFTLITSLAVLLMLTILGIGLYYRSAVSHQVGLVSKKTTQSIYYAETALRYLVWALYLNPDNPSTTNDEDLDGYNPPSVPENAASVGDRSELVADYAHPDVQVLYFDNRPLSQRDLVFRKANPPQPILKNLKLPDHYLWFSIDPQTGNVAVPVLDGTIGTGAAAWMTAAEDDPSNANYGDDIEIASERDYDLVVYALGYVNGQPMHLLRAIVGHVGQGPPIGLGSVTNGYR